MSDNQENSQAPRNEYLQFQVGCLKYELKKLEDRLDDCKNRERRVALEREWGLDAGALGHMSTAHLWGAERLSNQISRARSSQTGLTQFHTFVALILALLTLSVLLGFYVTGIL